MQNVLSCVHIMSHYVCYLYIFILYASFYLKIFTYSVAFQYLPIFHNVVAWCVGVINWSDDVCELHSNDGHNQCALMVSVLSAYADG